MKTDTLIESLKEAAAVNSRPIPAGYVRFERNEWHYSQQGAVTRVGHLTKDIPEAEVIDWLGTGCYIVTWPSGEFESFDMRVQPVRHDRYNFHEQTYGELIRQGQRETGTLSKLPNVFVTYYGPKHITAEERATFKPI